MGNIIETVEDDDIELADMETHEVEQLVSSMSPEGQAIRAARKKVRYNLYRCKTEAEGKFPSGCDEDFKKQFEVQDGFTGWRFFGINWDVGITNPLKVVGRELSSEVEWEKLIRAKFPQLKPDGSVTYPDITVKHKVDAGKKETEK